jgi:uncharacterized protein YjfI (DUF2170 family)
LSVFPPLICISSFDLPNSCLFATFILYALKLIPLSSVCNMSIPLCPYFTITYRQYKIHHKFFTIPSAAGK